MEEEEAQSDTETVQREDADGGNGDAVDAAEEEDGQENGSDESVELLQRGQWGCCCWQ